VAFGIGALALLIWAAAAEQLSVARFIPAPEMALPAYLVPATDPVTHASFVRVTDPGGPKETAAGCDPAYCTHRYSSAQAWNADQTLLLIANGCAGWCFLDGKTYVPRFIRHHKGECEWHPKDERFMICVAGLSVSLWDPRADRSVLVYTATGYSALAFGPSKGNPSRDGSRIVVRATRGGGVVDAFVVDIAERRALPPIHLDDLPGTSSACTISPTGRYVFCMQDLPGDIDQAYIFADDGKLVQAWTEHHRPGHGDMTVDADGEDVYVGISKSPPDEFHVIKRRLSDGAVTVLAPYGEAGHVSTRATLRPEWAFVSYGGDPHEVAIQHTWAPFAREVVALRIDGSGEVRRIAQTRNVPYNYWSETHASPSPDGSQVIWSSNWGKPGGPVYDFVSRQRIPVNGAGTKFKSVSMGPAR
jgi:hypothetical protein